MLPSQSRILTYLGRALSAAIRRLQAAGVPPNLVAVELQDVIASSNALASLVGQPNRDHCWTLTVPGNIYGYWVMQGGPWFPGAPTLAQLFPEQVPDSECRYYFAALEAAELDLSAALAAVQVDNWANVMQAAATEAGARTPTDRGMSFPLWLLLGLGALAYWKGR